MAGFFGPRTPDFGLSPEKGEIQLDPKTIFVVAITTVKMIMPGMPNIPGIGDLAAPTRTLTMNLRLPADATYCYVPAGIFKGMDSPMLSIVAVGKDKIQTRDGIETQVVVRSIATSMLGAGMMGMDSAPIEEAGKPEKKDVKPTEDNNNGDPADKANEGLDKVDKVKDTVNRAKKILKW